jgi:hypothetical protein
MTEPLIAVKQADLIIKLYELRRETVMRAARSYVGGAFGPTSIDEFVDIMSGGEHTSFVLQVYGYWDMVAAMVASGALDEDLVFNTCMEMYFQYAKIRPYMEEFRKRIHLPEMFIQVQKLVEGSEKGRARLDSMERYLQLIRGGAVKEDA